MGGGRGIQTLKQFDSHAGALQTEYMYNDPDHHERKTLGRKKETNDRKGKRRIEKTQAEEIKG